jgi:hypothetical protein
LDLDEIITNQQSNGRSKQREKCKNVKTNPRMPLRPYNTITCGLANLEKGGKGVLEIVKLQNDLTDRLNLAGLTG